MISGPNLTRGPFFASYGNSPTAPWYILNGAAGHYDGLDPLVLPLANYSRYTNDKTYGWSRLTFHNATHRECLISSDLPCAS